MRYTFSLAAATVIYVSVIAWYLPGREKAPSVTLVSARPVLIVPADESAPSPPMQEPFKVQDAITPLGPVGPPEIDLTDEPFAARPTVSQPPPETVPPSEVIEERHQEQAADDDKAIAPAPESPREPETSPAPDKVPEAEPAEPLGPPDPGAFASAADEADHAAEAASKSETASKPTVAGDPASLAGLPDLPEDLMQLPDLEILTETDAAGWRAIDRALGIVTVAYTIDGQEPERYLVWDEAGRVSQTDRLDRKRFSNRCRDRSHVDHFRRQLLAAKRSFGTARPMRIVGLVPAAVDRGFAAVQLEAVRTAGLTVAQVAATRAHYDLSGTSPSGLIIDEVVPIRARN